MRVADVQISFPAILIALLIDGVMRALLPGGRHEELVFYVLVLSIGLSQCV
jgi:peptide/nickel transport system permease protein